MIFQVASKIDDHYIDVLRARIKKKEANALLYNSDADLNKDEKDQKVKKSQTQKKNLITLLAKASR